MTHHWHLVNLVYICLHYYFMCSVLKISKINLQSDIKVTVLWLRLIKNSNKFTGILLMKYLQKIFLVDIFLRFLCTSLRQSGTFNFSFVPQNIWNKTFKVFIALIKLVWNLMHPIPLRDFLKGTEWGHRKMLLAILNSRVLWVNNWLCKYNMNTCIPG